MYVYYHVSWNPELVFATFSMPQEAKDPRSDTFILYIFLDCPKHPEDYTDIPSCFLSISHKLMSQQQLGYISRYKVNWKKAVTCSVQVLLTRS